MKNLARELKQRLLYEFGAGDRKGVYALTPQQRYYEAVKPYIDP